MLFFEGFRRIFLYFSVLFSIGATAVQSQKEQQLYPQQVRKVSSTSSLVDLVPQFRDYATKFLLSPNAFQHFSSPPSNEKQKQKKQYINTLSTKPKSNKIPTTFQRGNGNSFEDASKISMKFFFPIRINDEYFRRPAMYAYAPGAWMDGYWEKERNFRRSLNFASFITTTKQFEKNAKRNDERSISKNFNWLDGNNNNINDNNEGDKDDDDVDDDDDDDDVDDNVRMNYVAAPFVEKDVESGVKTSSSSSKMALNDLNEIIYNELPTSNFAKKDNLENKTRSRNRNRNLSFDALNDFMHPQIIKKAARQGGTLEAERDEKRSEVAVVKPIIFRNNKRERKHRLSTTFIPSVSTASITHLGHFFDDLSKNVHFNERYQFLRPQQKLLQGDHPLHMLQSDVDSDSDENSKIEKTADFLQAIRSYTPSQKIRSLVSMNPQGYHGSSFLDPNYMWVGLG